MNHSLKGVIEQVQKYKKKKTRMTWAKRDPDDKNKIKKQNTNEVINEVKKTIHTIE